LRKVCLLDPHTVNQIAAGEVVERPASVVKELVENAIDAGATRIEVILRDSGKSLICVSDDGTGMSLEDAQTALLRHATSKIRSVEDLLGVQSLGFRGEALPSIASVSRFTLSTGTEDGLRHVLTVVGGEMREPSGAAGPRGTEVRVEDLFFNTPARLKFLKSDSTELGNCLDHINRYAIGHPYVAFTATHNGQLALQTPGSGDRLEAIANVWGRETAKSLAEVDSLIAGIRVSGFVSAPHMTRPTRAYQFLYVNGRPVRSRMLTASLDQAYRDLTPDKRYPVVALFVEVDPKRLDVNVSPTKSEVKFQAEGQVFDAVRYAIRSALDQHGMMPSAAGIAAANEALAQARRMDSFGPVSSKAPSTFEASFLAQLPLDPTPIEVPPEEPALRSANYPFIELLDGLRVLGQIMNTFIVAETARGLVLIDQHVAHERVIYEHLCGLKGNAPVEKQHLLSPETLALDKRALVLIQNHLEEMERVGFDLELFGGETVIVRSVPAALHHRNPLEVLQDLIDELVDATVARRLTPTREQIWITSSCKMAVKAGDPLSIAEMEKLIRDLATTENPYLCPHGRPITITLEKSEILRKFKRA